MKTQFHIFLLLTTIAIYVVEAIVEVQVTCPEDGTVIDRSNIAIGSGDPISEGVIYDMKDGGPGVLKHQIKFSNLNRQCFRVEYTLEGVDDLQETKLKLWPWKNDVELLEEIEADFENVSKCQRVNVLLYINAKPYAFNIARSSINPLAYAFDALEKNDNKTNSPYFGFSNGNPPSVKWSGFENQMCESEKIHTKGKIQYIITKTNKLGEDPIKIDEPNYKSIFEIKKYDQLNVTDDENCYMEFNVKTKVYLEFFESEKDDITGEIYAERDYEKHISFPKRFVIRNDGNLKATFSNLEITIVREDKRELECLDQIANFTDLSTKKSEKIEIFKVNDNNYEATINKTFRNCTEYMFNLNIRRYGKDNTNISNRLEFTGTLFPEINPNVKNNEGIIQFEIETEEFKKCTNLTYKLLCLYKSSSHDPLQPITEVFSKNVTNKLRIKERDMPEDSIVRTTKTGKLDIGHDLSGMDCYAKVYADKDIDPTFSKINFIYGNSLSIDGIALVIVFLVILVLVVSASAVFFNYRFKQSSQLVRRFLNIPLGEVKKAYDRNSKQQQIIEKLPDWARKYYEPIEILSLGEEIGKGAFGTVYKGLFKMENDSKEVAVKVSIKKPHAEEELLSEGELMSKLSFHNNIINLLGVSVDIPENDGRFLLITEFCSEGGLLKKLRQMRKEQEKDDESNVPEVDAEQLVGWTYQIALGMEFLAETNTIHGDLAARNILLDSDNTAKIGDFGKAHSIHYSNIAVEVEGAQPLLWMAPEAIEESEVTLESDKWSYGVTIWELFSLGAHPYSVMMTNPTDRTSNLKKDLKRGYRMPQPEWCPTRMYAEVILPCWNLDPEQRPDWPDLIQLLSNLVDSEYLQNYSILVSKNKRTYQDIKNFEDEPFDFYV